MKTMVQSFLVEETAELIYDNDKLQEWKQKCEELGLTGQLDLASPEKSPIPFEHLNTVTKRVYETICPAKVNYKEYKKTTIPLEVLSLISLSEREQYFDKIEIWYDDKTPDPIAVGIKQGSNAWSQEFYSIARWADALREFSELKQMAIKIYFDTSKVHLESNIEEAKHKLNTLEINTKKYFNAQAEGYNVIGF